MEQRRYAFCHNAWILVLATGLAAAACRAQPRSASKRSDRPDQNRISQAAPNTKTPEHVTMFMSWAVWYTSLSELKQNSDFAIQGSITAVAPTVQPAAGPVYTMVTVTAARVVWQRDSSATIPASVTFEQTGGTYQNDTFEVEDDPLYQIGDPVVLFFKEWTPGKFRVSGGPTGRFDVKKDGVRPIVPNGIQIAAGTGVDTFARLL
jgi:hypothetical protein